MAHETSSSRSRQRLIIIFSLVVVLLAIGSVSYGAIRNAQLADLTECTNRVVLKGTQAFQTRDLIAIELNETNKRIVAARMDLFELLTRSMRGEDDVVTEADVDRAYDAYLQAAAIYEADINRYTEAIRSAPLIKNGDCSRL